MNTYCKVLFFILSAVLSELGFADTQTLMVSEGKRLEASIAIDAMNRLTVANDRIVNIFGDEGSFVSQSDDQTGQVFIKPTVENGSKPLSLTLITENGLTQDLILNPVGPSASTIILKNSNAPQSKNVASLEGFMPLPSLSENSFSSEPLLQLMKQAVLGELPICNKRVSSRRSLPGYKTSLVKIYQTGGYLISVWVIKNTSQKTEVREQDFYQPGDLAICLAPPLLNKDTKTLLYVLTRD